jgi:hypothetical protein
MIENQFENSKPVTACPKCGSQNFTGVESYAIRCSIDPHHAGVLNCKSGCDGGVDFIECRECGAPAPEGLQIEFN